MTKESKQFWQDMKWGREHHGQLLKKYKDEWIAIFKGKVIASGKILENVQKQAKKITGPKPAAVKFVECGLHIYGVFCRCQDFLSGKIYSVIA